MLSPEQVIDQTKKWILDVVIGCQFCPFAAREYLNHRIHYQVYDGLEKKRCLDGLLDECRRLDANANISTTLLIFPNAFGNFSEYLDFVYQAEKLLQAHSYTGQYQLASFHPDYRFAKSKIRDAANYTNRSIYPMLHILREDSLSEALATFPHPEEIPKRNQQFARNKGEDFMIRLREACK